jgi:hypothetical protein
MNGKLPEAADRADARASTPGTSETALLSAPPHAPEDYWSIVLRQFRKNRIAVFGLGIVLLLFVIALSGDFIAGDKPLVMSYRNGLFSPVLRDYAVWLGLTQWQPFKTSASGNSPNPTFRKATGLYFR